MSDDVKSQFERLVAGEWERVGGEGGNWACALSGIGRLGISRAGDLNLFWGPFEPLPRMDLWSGNELNGRRIAVAVGNNPVAALSALCCQPLAVSILHGLGAFPEVEEPDRAWRWWWVFLHEERPWQLVDVLQPLHPGLRRWRRAPEPPGQ